MGKGSEDSKIETNVYEWKEVKKHNNKNDLWIVIDGYVYDVTKFQKLHPGGAKIVNHFSGQDASVRFSLFICNILLNFVKSLL